MAAETKRDSIVATIRAFGQSDSAAAAEILRGSPEAAQWTEWGLKELVGWPGVLALGIESEGKVNGFIIGRQVAEEAEILNLAVVLVKRRQGEGGALLKAALQEFRARRVRRVVLEVREADESAIAFYETHGVSKTGGRPGYYPRPRGAAV